MKTVVPSMVFILLCTFIFTLQAQSTDSTVKVRFSGYNSLEFGQVMDGINVRGGDINGKVKNLFQLLMRTGFEAHAVFDERLALNMNVQIKLWHAYPMEIGSPGTQTLNFNTFLPEANGTYKLGDLEKPYLTLGMGYFLYKYNSDAKNLGEYLFRSTAYPQNLVTEFDFCYAQPLGIYLGSTLFDGMLKQDLFLTTNATEIPIFDIGLGYVATCTPVKGIEAGAGVRFTSLFPIDDSITMRKDIGSINMSVENGDTSFYTFAGTTLMGRISIDPKQFIPGSGFFGREDLKLYGEAAVLGLKNHGTIYDKLSERIPVMFGFNVPVFKVFDVLSFECEWFGSRYPNDQSVVVMQNYPVPNIFSGGTDLDTAKLNNNQYKSDDWKWSVYLYRSFGKHLSIIGQVANDHLRLSSTDWMRQDFEQTMRKAGNWYYVLKFKLAI